MKYMYYNEGEKRSKRSASYRAAESDYEDVEEEESDREDREAVARTIINKTASKPHRLSEVAKNDEISRLDKLAKINMGARYELLNANKMMLDFDLGMVRLLLHKNRK